MFQFVFMCVLACYVLQISESSCTSHYEGFLLTRKAMMKATLRHDFVCREIFISFEVFKVVYVFDKGKSLPFFSHGSYICCKQFEDLLSL
jgi:hypothetical protein